MNHLSRVAIVAMLALGFSGVGARLARADLITNGSFENPAQNGGFTIYSNGNVPGWTSNNNEIEIDTSSAVGLPGYAGTQSAELNGNTYDTISQTVTGLTVGQKYLITWAYAGRSGAGAQQMNVYFNNSGAANVQVGQNNAPDGTNWTSNFAVVTATGTSEVLSFAAINVGGNNPSAGNELDAVTLNTYVPEPGSLAILAVAAGGLVLLRRRASR